MTVPNLPSLPRFEPAVEPLWQRVYGYLQGVEQGKTVTWSQLSKALGLGKGSDESLFRAWNKAAAELEAEGWRFESVGKTGFRHVADGHEANPGIVEGSVEAAGIVELQAPENVPVWRLVYERFKRLEPDEVLSWEQIAVVMGKDVDADRQALRYGVNRAKKEMLKVDRCVVLTVRGHGYTVATPGQQLAMANRHQARAAREVSKGLALVEAVDPEKLDPETRKGFAVVGIALNEQNKVITHMSERQQNIEELIATVAEESSAGQRAIARTNQRLAEVEERLAKILGGAGQGEPQAGVAVQ